MSESRIPDYYAVLEVATDARQSVIDGAYRAILGEIDPGREGAVEDTQLLEEAYEMLSDPARRATYDEQIAQAIAAGVDMTEIDAEYQPQVATLNEQLQQDPTSYATLISLGNTFFDWAYATQQADPKSAPEIARPLWLSAADAYARALAIEDDAIRVRVDHAIAVFYSGSVADAITIAEAAALDNPEFAPAHFNLGIFYQAAGRTAVARAAYARYLELDPTGSTSGDPEYAKQQIAELQPE